MELPTVSSLSPIEARASVEFAEGDDPALHGRYYKMPFAAILDVAHRLSPTFMGELPDGCPMEAANWNEWLQGYTSWAVPENVGEEDMMRTMTKMMSGDSYYRYEIEKPQVQLPQFFAAPIVR
jgi:hypothetical protein